MTTRRSQARVQRAQSQSSQQSRRSGSGIFSGYSVTLVLAPTIPLLALLAVGPTANSRLALALVLCVLVGTVLLWRFTRGTDEVDSGALGIIPHDSRVYISGVVFAAQLAGLGLGGVGGLTLQLVTLILYTVFGKSRLSLRFGAVAIVLPLIGEAVADSVSYDLVAASVAIVAVVMVVSESDSVQHLTRAFAIGVAMYVGASLLLYLVGVEGGYATSYTGESLAAFGPFSHRWRLPLAASWTHVPMVALLGITLAVTASRFCGPVVSILNITMGALVLLGANGRVFVFLAISVVLLASGVLSRTASIVTVLVVQLAWVAPLWWAPLVSSGGSLLNLLVSVLPSRSAEGSLSILSLEGRTDIWSASLEAWANSPALKQWFGWGPNGYLDSGASRLYSYVFEAGFTSVLQPPHNAFLELLLSSGIIGAALMGAFVVFIVLLGVHLIRSAHGPETRIMVGLLTLTPLLGATEVAVLPSNATPVLLVWVALVSVLAVRAAQSVHLRAGRPHPVRPFTP